MDLFCRELFWPDGIALFRQNGADLGISLHLECVMPTFMANHFGC